MMLAKGCTGVWRSQGGDTWISRSDGGFSGGGPRKKKTKGWQKTSGF
jgi:hypothetical protein